MSLPSAKIWLPIVDGQETQQGYVTLPEAARTLAHAHRMGSKWDARIKGDMGDTWLTRTERDELIAAILKVWDEAR